MRPVLRGTATYAALHLAYFFAPVFQRFLYYGHELVGYGSVDDAMVVAECEVNYGTDGDGICSVFVGDDHGLLGDAADAHDGRVRLVDDGQTEDGSKLTGVGDSEGGTFDVGGQELFCTGALAKIGDAALQSEEVEIVGVFEDGDDESPIERDGDTGVDMLVIAEAIAFHGAVDDWKLLQGDDGGAHEEGHEGEARAVALLEAVLELIAQTDDAGQIHLEHAVDVSAGTAGFDHALGNDLAHLRHGDEIAGNHCRRRGWGWAGCGCGNGSCRPMLDEIEYVLLGDAATSTSAIYSCEIHIVLAGKLADERGRADVGGFFLVFVFFFLRSDGGGLKSGSFLSFFFGRRGSGGSRSGGLGGSAIAVANDADDGVDLNGIAFGNLDLLKNSAGGRGDFSVDLIGGNLEQGFVALDLFAGFFQPLGDGSFED